MSIKVIMATELKKKLSLKRDEIENIAFTADSESDVSKFNKSQTSINIHNCIPYRSVVSMDSQNFSSRRFTAQSKFERLIKKNGIANAYLMNIPHSKYISDFFNTIVDLPWIVIIAFFSVAYLISWISFTICWYYNSALHFKYFNDECIAGIGHQDSFYHFLLFSIETQQTIGYGTRALSPHCGFSAFILMCQCSSGIFLECFLGGVLFSKLSRPKKRVETLFFSNLAVIAKRDGIYCFMCRVGDLRKSHIIISRVNLYIVRTRYTQEGEVIPCHIEELKVSNSKDCLLFAPIIVEHQIDTSSPLYELLDISNSFREPNRFKSTKFEILVTLEGSVESTGASIQARSSYLPSEIHWNKIFEPLIDTYHDNSKANIDFSKFNNTRDVLAEPQSLVDAKKIIL